MKTLAYYLDFYTMPVFMALLLLASPPGGVAWLASFAAGWLAWTMAEYYIHRSLFHRMFRRQHWWHHLEPMSEDGAVPSFVSHLVGVFALYLAVAFFGLRLGVAGFEGFAVGYWLYAVLHHGIHHGWFSPFGVLGGLVRRHEVHHRGEEVNFNFVLPIGDWIFGTYRRASFSTFAREEWERIHREG